MKKVLICTFIIVSVIYCIYFPPRIIRKIRNEVVYRLPFSIPGLPVCPDCNIVLVNLDTLRPSNMGCYGYVRDTMPNLCGYAKKNIFFSQFYTQTSFTLDSHMSIFTGLYPTTHHVLEALKDTLNPKIPTFPSVLQAHGYRTIWAGIINDVNLPLNKGLERGFSEIHNLNGTSPDWRDKYKNILPVLNGDKPAFIFFHSYAPHSPYLPGNGPWHFSTRKLSWIPVSDKEYYKNTFGFYTYVLSEYQRRLQSSVTKESRERNENIVQRLSTALAAYNIDEVSAIFWSLPEYEQYDLNIGWYWKKIDPKNPEIISYMKDIYDERIYQIDQDMKDLLDFVSAPDVQRRTIVMVISDNGEDFAEHGYFDHGWNIYNTGTRAPFIIGAPKLKSDVYNELASAIDIYPTLLDLVGIQRKNIPLEGKSLVSIMSGKGEDQVGERYLISQHRGDIITSIRSTRWKMYKNNTVEHKYIELYDLMTDPNEQKNILGEHLDIARHLDDVLTHMLSISPKYASVSGMFPDWLDEEKRQTLTKEGYF